MFKRMIYWNSPLLALGCLTVALTAFPAAAQQPHAHQHGGSAPIELGTSAASDRHGKLWAVTKEATDDGKPVVGLRSSSDMGASWSKPRQIAQEPVTARGDERPKVVFGPKGELYLLYTRPLPGSKNPHIGDIRFVRSTDGGKSFSNPVTVHANRDAIVHAFGTMIVDKAGMIYVAWIDGRHAAQAKARQEPYAGSAIYYAVSTDGGASFKGDYKIADHTCECCRISLALNAQGRPVAMWRHVFEPNIRDHALAQLGTDGKASPVQRATFDDWRIDACPHHGPSVAFGDDGKRHQVWFNGKEGDSGGALYATASADGTLGKPVQLGSEQASHPDVAVQGQFIAVVWKQFDGNSTAILARISEDGGASWQEKELARTSGDSSHPQLMHSPSGIALVWRTQQEGIRVVSFKKEKS